MAAFRLLNVRYRYVWRVRLPPTHSTGSIRRGGMAVVAADNRYRHQILEPNSVLIPDGREPSVAPIARHIETSATHDL